MDSYRIPTGNGASEYVEKRSRFLGLVQPVGSEDEARDKYTIVGTACESTDVFDENVTLRKTRRGDLLTIKSAGAYGMSMASRYNLHDLPGAVYSDEIQ